MLICRATVKLVSKLALTAVLTAAIACGVSLCGERPTTRQSITLSDQCEILFTGSAGTNALIITFLPGKVPVEYIWLISEDGSVTAVEDSIGAEHDTAILIYSTGEVAYTLELGKSDLLSIEFFDAGFVEYRSVGIAVTNNSTGYDIEKTKDIVYH